MAERNRLAARISWIGLVAGPIAAIAVYLLIPQAGEQVQSGLSQGGRAAAAVGALMAVWWLTEALPLPVTSLVPIALFPLVGVLPIDQVTAQYGHKLIFLFMGGFILGLSMQKWGLHRRIALVTILIVGTKPTRLVAGFMLATAVMSMWVSNTATVVMMLPIAVSLMTLVSDQVGAKDSASQRDSGVASLGVCLMLGIAYAASIGGVGTLIGTPPNGVLKFYVEQSLGKELTFSSWLPVGLPLVVVFLPIAWLLLTRVIFPIRLESIPGGRQLMRENLRSLGRMSGGEWATFVVFMLTACAWVFRPQLLDLLALVTPSGWGRVELSDEGIAIISAIALFVIPVRNERKRIEPVMDWKTAAGLPWGVLLLFGGGLALARGLTETGVDQYIGAGFAGLSGVPTVVLVLAVALVVTFLTEVTSNTAVTTALLPVLGGAAGALGVDPWLLLLPATLAASCAFMLPVATPPNAIVFASGHVTMAQMARAGLVLNLVGVVIITVLIAVVGLRPG